MWLSRKCITRMRPALLAGDVNIQGHVSNGRTTSHALHLIQWRYNMPPDEYACEDCGNEFFADDGQPYKYEPTIWLCEGCHDQRLKENELEDAS